MALSKQEKKKIVAIGLWQCHCRNREKKIVAIVAMPLPKMEGKKIVVAKIWGGIKKKSATFTIFLQHFHNKLQVISYYQFKFEFNIEFKFELIITNYL